MIAKTLITHITPENQKAYNLVFQTLRRGMPTYDIEVHFHDSQEAEELLCPEARALITHREKPSERREAPSVHPRWVCRQIEEGFDPFVLFDPDIVFFDNVEPMVNRCSFSDGSGIVGELYPSYHHELGKRNVAARIHPCFMLVDPFRVRENCRSMESWVEHVEHQQGLHWLKYWLMPTVTLLNRYRMFYDTCGYYYQNWGGQQWPATVLDNYEHLGNATFSHLDDSEAAPMRSRYDEVYANPYAAKGFRAACWATWAKMPPRL